MIRDLGEWHAWLNRAKPGETVTYHVGYLATDRYWVAPVQDARRRELDELASAVMGDAEAGWVELVQRKLAESTYAYLALRTKEILG